LSLRFLHSGHFAFIKAGKKGVIKMDAKTSTQCQSFMVHLKALAEYYEAVGFSSKVLN
jgi:hypothetical protein